MKAVINKIRLDMAKTQIRTSVSICKGDTNSRQICITLINSGAVYEIPDNCVAVLIASKADGKAVYNDCSICGNEIIFDVTSQLVAVVGDVECQIELSDVNGTIMASPYFILRVYEKLFDSSVLESTNEYKALTSYYLGAKNAASQAENNALKIEEQLKNTGMLIAQNEQLMSEYSGTVQAFSDQAHVSAEGAGKSADLASQYANAAETCVSITTENLSQVQEAVKTVKGYEQSNLSCKEEIEGHKSDIDHKLSLVLDAESNAKDAQRLAAQYANDCNKSKEICHGYYNDALRCVEDASKHVSTAGNKADEASRYCDQASERAEYAANCKAEIANMISGERVSYNNILASESRTKDAQRLATQAVNEAAIHADSANNAKQSILESESNITKLAQAVSLSEKRVKASEQNVIDTEATVGRCAEIINEKVEDFKQDLDRKIEGSRVFDEVKKALEDTSNQETQNSLAIAELDDRKINAIYASNLGEQTITDCSEGSIRHLKIEGATSQQTYRGYQLLTSITKRSFHFEEKESNHCDVVVDEDGIHIISATLSAYIEVISEEVKIPNGTYYFIAKTDNNAIYPQIIVSKKDDTTTYITKNGSILNLNDDIRKITFTVQNCGSFQTDISANVIAMLTEVNNLTEDDFELYVGGSPSPSPDYPQEIHSVEQINVKVTNAEDEILQQFTITPPRPLNMMSVCKDICDVEDGVWRYNTFTIPTNNFSVFEASISEKNYRNSGIDRIKISIKSCNTFLSGNNRKPCITNIAKFAKTGYAKNSCFLYNNQVIFQFDSTSEVTLEKIKSIKDNIVIIAQANEQETEPIAHEDLEKLLSLRTYDGTTNIIVTDQNGNDISTFFDYHFNLKPFVEHIKTQVGVDKELIYDMEVSNAWALINATYSEALTDVQM